MNNHYLSFRVIFKLKGSLCGFVHYFSVSFSFSLMRKVSPESGNGMNPDG